MPSTSSVELKYRGLVAGLAFGDIDDKTVLNAAWDKEAPLVQMQAILEAMSLGHRHNHGDVRKVLFIWVMESLAKINVPEQFDVPRRLLWSGVHTFLNQDWNHDQRTRINIFHLMFGAQSLFDKMKKPALT